MFAKVYRMLDKQTKQQLAVKIVEMRRAKRFGIDLSALLREARCLLALHHPNIIRYFTTCWDEYEDRDGDIVSDFCLVMELAPGGTLAKLVQNGAALSGERLQRMAAQLCSALHHMHAERRIVHRDLKPENVLLTEDGDAKICDLGLACTVASKAKLTYGTGSLAYMSPEKGGNKLYSFPDDMWALGCIFFELATMRTTHSMAPHGGLFSSLEQVPRMVEMVRAAHPRFAALVEQLLAKDPAARPTAKQALAMVVEQ